MTKLAYIGDGFIQLGMESADVSADSVSSLYDGQAPMYLQGYADQTGQPVSHALVTQFKGSGQWGDFHSQIVALVTRLRQWCLDNVTGLTTAQLADWGRFQTKFLDYRMQGNAATIAYTTGKQALEAICLHLSSPKLERAHAVRVLKNALQNGELNVCTEGTVTNVLNLGRDLQLGALQSFKSYVLQVVGQLSIEAVNRLRGQRVVVDREYETHVSILFLNPLLQLLGLPVREDAYTASWSRGRQQGDQLKIFELQSQLVAECRQAFTLGRWLTDYVQATLLPKIRACSSPADVRAFLGFLDGFGKDTMSAPVFFDENCQPLDELDLVVKLKVTLHNRLVQAGIIHSDWRRVDHRYQSSTQSFVFNPKKRCLEPVTRTTEKAISLVCVAGAQAISAVILPDKDVVGLVRFLCDANEEYDLATQREPVWQQAIALDIQLSEQDIGQLLFAAVQADAPGFAASVLSRIRSTAMSEAEARQFIAGVVAIKQQLQDPASSFGSGLPNDPEQQIVLDSWFRDALRRNEPDTLRRLCPLCAVNNADLHREAVFFAVANNESRLLQELLTVRVVDNSYATAVDQAVREGSESMVRMLIRAGATLHENRAQAQARLRGDLSLRMKNLLQYDQQFQNAWQRFAVSLSAEKRQLVDAEGVSNAYIDSLRAAHLAGGDTHTPTVTNFESAVYRDRSPGVRIFASIVINALLILCAVATLGIAAMFYFNAENRSRHLRCPFFLSGPKSAGAYNLLQRDMGRATAVCPSLRNP
jgi:hypothetical protein